MGASDRARGKAFERWVAARLGYRRRRSGETFNGYDDNVMPDGSLAPISIEAKAHAVLQLRTEWIKQARTNAGSRPWALVQRPKGWREPVVTIGWSYFERLVELEKDARSFIDAFTEVTTNHQRESHAEDMGDTSTSSSDPEDC